MLESTTMPSIRTHLAAVGLRALLWARSRPETVYAAAAGLALPRGRPVEAGRVTVAAVQMRSDPVPSAAAYVHKVGALLAQAVARGAQLVVFPEYAGLPLLGLIPGVVEGGSQALAQSGVSIPDILRVALPAADRVWRATHSTLAARCGVTVMAGTLPQAAALPGRFHNTAFLFGPEGKLIGVQPKLHLIERELAWAVPGDALRVFDLGWGRVAILVCMDCTYWETARIAAAGGAEILLVPVAEPTAHDAWRQARGIRTRVQETPVFGVQACLVGDLLGETATGATAVFAPLGLISPVEDTVAACQTTDEEEVVIAELDLAALRRFRSQTPADANPALQARYLPAVYRLGHETGDDGTGGRLPRP